MLSLKTSGKQCPIHRSVYNALTKELLYFGLLVHGPNPISTVRWRTPLLPHISQQPLRQAQRLKFYQPKKVEKCRAFENRYVFCPVAAETMGPIEEGSLELLGEIGRRLISGEFHFIFSFSFQEKFHFEISGEPRETQFIFQGFSIILQRGNAASFKGSFATPCLDAIWGGVSNIFLFYCQSPSGS